MKEACEESLRRDDTDITIASTSFGDLDGDGREEAAVTGYSCMAGTYGTDVMAVFKLQPTGEIVEMDWDRSLRGKLFQGHNPFEGLRGKMGVSIEQGKLTEVYPVYAKDDPNSSPSLGTREFVYRWDGHQFILDDIIGIPPG
ncbi:MAG TPA: hypothetical protein VFN26_05285 [Candidatus Acidoferrum sp.]|nr:hypothetical protein [Candidatus Acidoferrum sp.]